MNWSRGLFRAWVLGSTLWLLGWTAHLLVGWPRLPAETADCEAVKRKAATETLTDNEMKCVAFLRLIDERSVVDHQMRYGFDADQGMQNVFLWSVIDAKQDLYQMKGEDEFF